MHNFNENCVSPDSTNFTNAKSSRKENDFLQEGMVTSNNNRINHKSYYENCISNHCGHICCTGLTTGLWSLNIGNNVNSPKKLLNLNLDTDTSTITSTVSTTKSISPLVLDNPFRRERRSAKKRKHSPEPPKIYDFCSNVTDYDVVKTPDTMSPNINLDISFVSTIVENFDKESTDFTLDLNPVILERNISNLNNFGKASVCVPELEEFDNNKLNDTVKSSIPQDLYNLNLQKFSPSPVMQCLSPQSNSPSHPFAHENNCEFNEQIEESNIDLKNRVLPGHLKSDIDYSSTICNYDLKDCDSLHVITSSNSLITNDIEERVIFDDDLSDNKFSSNFETDSKFIESIEEDNGNVRTSGDKEEIETRLPLKKRKLSVVNNKGEEVDDEDFLGPDLVEEIIRRARAEKADKEDISYPAKPMISIAEIQDKLAEQTPRIFKTPAEKKEMPPPPLPSEPAACNSNAPPKVVTEQYNNLTYNNPTIYYHMNNVPYPFFPCASLPYFPSFIVPMNSTTTIDMNVVPKPEQQQQNQQPQVNQDPPAATPPTRPKREKKSRGRKKHN